jgi:hypothetical protein
MNRRKYLDTTLAGLGIGMVGMVIGFLLLAIVWALLNKMSVSYFIEKIFLSTDLFKDKILTVSVLFNVFIFYISNRAEYYRTSRGILLAVLLVVPFIIYYN